MNCNLQRLGVEIRLSVTKNFLVRLQQSNFMSINKV